MWIGCAFGHVRVCLSSVSLSQSVLRLEYGPTLDCYNYVTSVRLL